MQYKGGCHCGNITIEVEGDLSMALSCNCSICTKKGALLWAVPHDTLKVAAPVAPGRYLFHNNVLAHRFCTVCGIHPYAEDASEAGPRSAYINLRCIEALDLKTVPIMEFDGRSA